MSIKIVTSCLKASPNILSYKVRISSVKGNKERYIYIRVPFEKTNRGNRECAAKCSLGRL